MISQASYSTIMESSRALAHTMLVAGSLACAQPLPGSHGMASLYESKASCTAAWMTLE